MTEKLLNHKKHILTHCLIILLICGLLTSSSVLADELSIAYTSTQGVLVNGERVEFKAYALKDKQGNSTNYVKLRDVAYVLNGTEAQFEVSWDGAVNILTHRSYTADGSEMTTPFSGDQTYTDSAAETKINGLTVPMEAIVLTDEATGGAYTYYKLRDLGTALGFTVDWSQEKGMIVIETGAMAPAVTPAYYDDQPVKVPKTVEDFRVTLRYMMRNGLTKYQVETTGTESYAGGIHAYAKALQDTLGQAYALASSDYWEYHAFYAKYGLSYTWYPVTGDDDSFRDLNYTLTLTPRDGIAEDALQKNIAAFDTEIGNILTQLTQSGELRSTMSDHDKALVLFRYLDCRLAYDTSYTQTTPITVLRTNVAVCSGYTALYSALCHQVGMKVYSVEGTSNGGSHAWTAIVENGVTYYMDPTHGDPIPDRENYSNTDYCWVTGAQLLELDPTRTMTRGSLT
jgi:hypothetical protein